MDEIARWVWIPLLLYLVSIALVESVADSTEFNGYNVGGGEISSSMGSGGEMMEGGAGGGGGYKSSYTRFAEVQEKCASILVDSTSNNLYPKPKPNPNPSSAADDAKAKVWSITNELTFLNGDWKQQNGPSPLMPFISRMQSGNSGSSGGGAEEDEEKDPVSLASLWITDVDLQAGSYKPGQQINISAVMELGISSVRTLSYVGSSVEGFQIYPGFSLLSFLMEGIYTELPNGDRRLCMLGCTRLPLRGKNDSDPWDWARSVSVSSSSNGGFSPPVSDDCKVMADVNFPAQLTLTTRAVKGTLSSFHSPSNSAYFNLVDLRSQLGAYSNYEFESARGSCGVNPSPTGSDLLYRGRKFCTVIMEVLSSQWLSVVPNWNCSLTEAECSKLGPFSDKALDGGFNGTRILVQDVRCIDFSEPNGNAGANVSALLRVVLPSHNGNMAVERTGMDNLTLAMEGKWNATSGQLCMTGCRSGDSSSCDTRISMSVPLSLSLKQRAVLLGSITSLPKETSAFYPLLFRMPLQPPNLPMDLLKNISYEFTKINEAGALLEKDEPVGFGERFKKSLLKYPSLDSKGGAKQKYMELTEDISVHSLSITNPNSEKGPHLKRYVDLDVIALEGYVGINWMQGTGNFSSPFEEAADDSEKEPMEQKDFLRVAAIVKIKDDLGNSLSDFSAEGEYDPAVGRMYLVGCREVHSPWKVLNDNSELLEDGLDCMLSMKVEFPPLNARWFMNPTVMLTISSTRNDDDPLYFAAIELETFPILYRRQRDEIVSRKSLEGILSIVTLSLMIACIIAQLLYIREHIESIPYISHISLAIQAVGYSLPLITGVEALFARFSSDTDDMKSSVLSEGKGTQVISYMVNVLTLAAFLLTLRIVQKVYKARIRLLTRRPLEPWRVPSDQRVLGICSGIHLLGFVSVFLVHIIRIHNRPVSASTTYMDYSGGLHRQRDWEQELREYFGLVQDLFLLPQVVGNHIWDVQGKPLRKLFYIGVTALRLLPHLYDSLRPPVFNPYFADEYQYANPTSDFYSKAADIAIPLLAIILAAVVYTQQRWNGLRWGKVIKTGSSRLMRMGSKMYERLPSKTFEAEMIEAVDDHLEDAPENTLNGHATNSDD